MVFVTMSQKKHILNIERKKKDGLSKLCKLSLCLHCNYQWHVEKLSSSFENMSAYNDDILMKEPSSL